LTQQLKTIHKNIEVLNILINQQDLAHLQNTPSNNRGLNILFKYPQKIQQIDILGQKTNFNKLQRCKIIQRVIFDHNRIRVEINNRKIPNCMETKQQTSKQSSDQRGCLKRNCKIYAYTNMYMYSVIHMFSVYIYTK
jgi:uncharacterized protein YicC (UPF0701 family)